MMAAVTQWGRFTVVWGSSGCSVRRAPIFITSLSLFLKCVCVCAGVCLCRCVCAEVCMCARVGARGLQHTCGVRVKLAEVFRLSCGS